MHPFEVEHWRTVNIMVRVVGIGAIAVGAAFLLSVIAGLIAPESLWGAWVREDGNSAATTVLVGVGAVLSGVGLCRKRTYRPDLGDAFWFAEPMRAKLQRRLPRGRRNWWTGDPRVENSQRDA